jgi:hypothetical protein
MHHQCQGRKGCHCHWYPKCIYPDASRRWRGYGNHQDLCSWISEFRLLPTSTSPMSWLRRKGWNSCWYSARMPYMVQWLQAYCTIANSPRVSRFSPNYMNRQWQVQSTPMQ